MPIIVVMEETVKQPKRGLAAIRLLAAALAGAIGAFGMPPAAHRAQVAPRSSAPASSAAATDSQPD